MKKSFATLTNLLISVSIFSQTPWSLTGNAGTSTSNFVGTTDNNPLILRVNNQWAGFTGFQDKGNVTFGYLSFNPLNEGDSNTAIGSQALQWNSSGSNNVAVGRWALEWNGDGSNNVAIGMGALGSGSCNVAVGTLALRSNRQSCNTAIGYESALLNSEGVAITAVGFKALRNNTTGTDNSALGFNALIGNTTGKYNTAVGAWSLVINETGSYNTTIGMKSLYSNTTGGYNTAIGAESLELNTTGYWNVALGSGALNRNTTGYQNTAGGNSSMWFNTTGIENTAFGEQSLGGGIDGSFNTAVGCRALWSVRHDPAWGDIGYGHGYANTALGYEAIKEVTSGGYNTGVGVHSLKTNNTGSENAAMGVYSLYSNTSGNKNIAIGSWTLGANTEGNNNVAVGDHALINNTTGNHNTAIGFNANVGKNDLTNTTVIGSGALATASNQVRIGNNYVTSIGGIVPWSNLSDERVKANVQHNVLGLAFINKLQPVTYNLDLDKTDNIFRGNQNPISADSFPISPQIDKQVKAIQQSKRLSGFIAQDVERVAQSIGYDFSGVDIDENGIYSLQYSTLIVPLVKAVQELSEQNDAKEANIASLQERLNALSVLVNKLIEQGGYNLSSPNNVSVPNASLEQNYPNPFNQSTTISYSLPQTFNFAKIVITDTSGRIFNQMSISGSGAGQVIIEAGLLPAGMYFYSLYVDNTLIDTKKMIIKK